MVIWRTYFWTVAAAEGFHFQFLDRYATENPHHGRRRGCLIRLITVSFLLLNHGKGTMRGDVGQEWPRDEAELS